MKAPGAYYERTGERPWSERRVGVARVLAEAQSDIIGSSLHRLQGARAREGGLCCLLRFSLRRRIYKKR